MFKSVSYILVPRTHSSCSASERIKPPQVATALAVFFTITGWWYTYPSEQNMSQLEGLSHILWKKIETTSQIIMLNIIWSYMFAKISKYLPDQHDLHYHDFQYVRQDLHLHVT